MMRLIILSLFLLSSYSVFAYDFEECQKRSKYEGTTIPFDVNGEFIPECAPDTLYSWQEHKHVRLMVMANTVGMYFPFNKELYTWRTPAGTYAFGNTPIRMKLRPDVKFRLISQNNRDCSLYTDEEKENTVFVAYLPWLEASEYILCDNSPVDSWSYGTSYNLEEIRREVRYIDCNREELGFDAYMKPRWIRDDQRFGFSVDVDYVNEDGAHFAAPWTEETLVEHIGNVEAIIQAGGSRIFYSPDARANNRDHFHTERPSYYTPPASASE